MKRLPLIVVIIAVLASCATQGVYVGPSKEELKLMDMVKAINKAGGVAVIGTGIDENGREDLALQKAILDGRTQLAQVFETNMQVLEKNFVEEIGAASSAEINQLFSSTVKAITNTTLVGSQSLSNPIIKRSSKVITVKVVVGIDPKRSTPQSWTISSRKILTFMKDTGHLRHSKNYRRKWMLTRSPISWFHKIALRSRTIQLLFLVMMLVPVHTVSGQSSLPSWFITPPEYTSAAIFASSDEEAIANAAKVLAAFERSIVWGNFRTFYDSSIDTDTWFDTDYFYYIPVAEIERIQQGLQVMASTVVSVLPSTRLFLVGKQVETMPNWEMELTADAVRPQWVDTLRFERMASSLESVYVP